MPFINGRYHINPVMGQALEAAREAETALAALQQRASRDSSDSPNDASRDDNCDPDDPTSSDALAGPGPIHHVEIEVQEGLPGRRLVEPGRSDIVPASSGRAVRGFVARVHRLPAEARSANNGIAPPPETHVFADHRDLVNFLRDALAKDFSQR
jgi:hypothetical protein